MTPFPAALLVAHPGHELRLFRWLEVAKPLVFVLTDGSGSGRSRIRSTIDILDATGCARGSIMGAFTDREIFRLMLKGDVEPIAAITREMADSLVAHGIRSIVADAFELYNPIHDLCSVIAALAAQRAEIPRFEYAVTEASSGNGETLELDDAAMARKFAAAHRYEELSGEVDDLIARVGVDALRREVLEPCDRLIEVPELTRKPFYETHGERRVAEGRYTTVLRYEPHFRSFAENLIAAVNASHACR